MPSRLTVVLVSLLLALPVVIFWLWLVILPARVAKLCPEGCRCDIGGYDVDCDNSSITSVPIINLRDVRLLSISENNMSFFERDSFVSLTHLETLVARNCGLRTIKLGAFNGLTKLTGLYIGHNEISEILPGTFESMNSLEYLDLGSNRLVKFDSGVFSGLDKLKSINLGGKKLQFRRPDNFSWLPKGLPLNLNKKPGLHIQTDSKFKNSHSLTLPDVIQRIFGSINSLEYLDLRNNRLVNLSRDVFSELGKLTFINLGGNKLKFLHPDTFSGLRNLEHLYLDNNPGLHIPTDRRFIKSHSLSYLHIARCNVSSVSVATFANVRELEWLDLSYNNLRTVDINIMRALPKLSTLYLYGNPLQCDCQLQKVWQWCEDRNIWTGNVKCDTPREVKEMWWGVLEKGKCLDGNMTYYGDYNSTHYSYTDTDHNISYEDVYDKKILNFYKLPVYAVPLIFGITSNVIIVLIIICNKDMRTVPNMYILNLATSDIIHLTVIFFEFYTNTAPFKREDDDFMCTFLPFCLRLPVFLSAYSLAVFSFQRYRVTANSFHVRVSPQATWRVTVAAICGVWIVSASFAVPSVLSNYMCQYTSSMTYYRRVVIFELLASCVLPLCVIAFSHITTARHLVESSPFISEGTENPQLNTRRNTAKIVVGLVLVFLISYVPYNAFWTHFICSDDFFFSKFNNILDNSENKFQNKYLISTCFLPINSCLNPVALFCTSNPFRQHLKRYLTWFCKRNSPPTDFELRIRT